MKGNRRENGLTLLEVLAAAVLLSTLAAAIVPILRDLRDPGETGDSASAVSIDALARAADATLAGDSRESLDALEIGANLLFPWPKEVAREGAADSGSIQVTRKRSGGVDITTAEGAWWVFTLRDQVVLRYGRIERDPRTEKVAK